MKPSKAFELMSKPWVVGSTLMVSCFFAVILTFADPSLIRSRLGLPQVPVETHRQTPSGSDGGTATFFGASMPISTNQPSLAVTSPRKGS